MMPMIAFGLLEAAAAGAAAAVVACTCGTAGGAGAVVGLAAAVGVAAGATVARAVVVAVPVGGARPARAGGDASARSADGRAHARNGRLGGLPPAVRRTTRGDCAAAGRGRLAAQRPGRALRRGAGAPGNRHNADRVIGH